jgi:Peptidase family S41
MAGYGVRFHCWCATGLLGGLIWLGARAASPPTAPTTQSASASLSDPSALEAVPVPALDQLTTLQIDNLFVLGKVWGFLKYHHPAITAGRRNWDEDLLRVLPAIIAAKDVGQAHGTLLAFIDELGATPACNPCVSLDTNQFAQLPNIAWIEDRRLLGLALSERLRAIYRNRSAAQFYVSLMPQVGNPSFDHEAVYAEARFPNAGLELLALYRYWNIIEYFSPNREIVGANWDDVLRSFIPKLALAKSRHEYEMGLFALIASVHDTHANLWSALGTLPPAGHCQLPLTVRFIGDQAVVSGFASGSGETRAAVNSDPFALPDFTLDHSAAAASNAGVQIGDVLTAIDGVAVAQLVVERKPYYAASNEAAQLRDIGDFMSRGVCGNATVQIERDQRRRTLTLPRLPNLRFTDLRKHDLPGPTFRLLSSEVAYLKLSSVKAADAANYLRQAAGTKGLIIDIRNYPAEFVVFALGRLLVSAPTPFARFTRADLANPGGFLWSDPLVLSPQALPATGNSPGQSGESYAGKIIILVDEDTQSQAEYTTMALRAAPHAQVIGSTTAGADGNVSKFVLPGNLTTMISGLGVFYPDRRPTQRVGIVPDIRVVQTVKGLAAGRDEVLEAALREILGNRIATADLQKMYTNVP